MADQTANMSDIKQTGLLPGLLVGALLSLGIFIGLSVMYPLDFNLDRVETVPIPEPINPEMKPAQVDLPEFPGPELAETESARPDIPETEPVVIETAPAEEPAPAAPTDRPDPVMVEASPAPAPDATNAAETSGPRVVATPAPVPTRAATPAGVSAPVDDGSGDGPQQIAVAPTVSSAAPRIGQPLASPARQASAAGVPSTAPAAPVGPRRPVVRSGTDGLGARTSSLIAPAPSTNESAPIVDNTSVAPVLGTGLAGGAATDTAEPGAAPTPALVAPPWLTNAAAYELTTKPLLAVILRDAGRDGIPLEQLGSLGFPVTIAVPVDMPEAAARAEIIRAAGFEVLVALPTNEPILTKGADPEAVAKRLDQYMRLVPGAIGLLDNINGVIARDNTLARTVSAHFTQTGHSLVTYRDFGIDVGFVTAESMGLPALSVDGFLDMTQGKGGVQAELNNAAFTAQRNGHSVVLGDTTLDLLNVLVTWKFASAARTLSISPASAALKRSMLEAQGS